MVLNKIGQTIFSVRRFHSDILQYRLPYCQKETVFKTDRHYSSFGNFVRFNYYLLNKVTLYEI